MEQVRTPGWLQAFPGNDHSFHDCELIGLQFTDASMLSGELELMETKWFDYVRLHPVKQTYLFAHVYGQQFGKYLSTNINVDLAFYRGLKGDVMVSRERRQFWALRQVADRMAMPYEIFLRKCFDHFASIGWTRPPRPSHILKATDAIANAKVYWDEALKDRSVFAADPWFKTDRYCGSRFQARHEAFVVEQVRRRGLKHFALSNALYVDDVLRIETALEHFDEETIIKAMEHAESFMVK